MRKIIGLLISFAAFNFSQMYAASVLLDCFSLGGTAATVAEVGTASGVIGVFNDKFNGILQMVTPSAPAAAAATGGA